MPLSVKLTIVPKELAKDETQTMRRRSDIPTGVVIEDKSKGKMPMAEVEEEADLKVEESQISQPADTNTNAYSQERDDEGESELNDNAPKSPRNDNKDNSSLGNSNATMGSICIDEDRQQKMDDDNIFYAMRIESTGKFSRKAELEDIARFAKIDNCDSDKLKEWLKSYLEQNYPHQLEKPNCIPRSAHIKDDPKKGFDSFKTYGWKPVKLNLQPGLVDVKDQWTKQITLEQFELNYSTDLETALKEKGDKEVVSYLRKGKMEGHPLALDFMKMTNKSEESQIVTEFRGIDSVVFQLGNNQKAATLDEETGSLVWEDVKKLRALLKDKPLPKKTGKGVSRTVDVLALESYMKARVYYKANFTGTVSTDHGNEQFDGQRYWNWDLKYLLRYNGIPNAIVMYQDIELRFFSQVQYAMENEDWEWQRRGGSWVKATLDTSRIQDYDD